METTKQVQAPAPSEGKPRPPNSPAEMDRALDRLSAHKEAWAKPDVPGRIALLDQIKRDLAGIEERWIDAALQAKGATRESPAEGIERVAFIWAYRQIRFLRKALQDIDRFGKPRIPGKVTTRANGQVVAQVMPYDWMQRIVAAGARAEVWMEPSVSVQAEGIPQAGFYRQRERQGKVCLVLGAGNVGGLVIQDALAKLFVEGQVVALKLNPVNAYLGPILEEGFASLIRAGLVQLLYGGAAEGAYLCDHPSVTSVHMTGSERTFDAIVFGPGPEGAARKQAHQPRFTKPFTAELGSVSPMIIVPGPWTKKDIMAQAARLGSWLVPNSAHNCLTPRMIIQMAGWEHRRKLNQAIADYLAGIKTSKAYYPGSFELHRQFVEAHPQARQLGDPQAGDLPWTFIDEVDATNADDICFRREPFISLFSETALEARNAAEFVGQAVTFANERLWGNLVASILVHPASLKDKAVAQAVEQAVADLRYGSVVVNEWGGIAHSLMITPWGAYPGNDIHDVQSGIGFVNNPLMFDRVQKSVVYANFTPTVDPVLATARNTHRFYRRVARHAFDPSVVNLFRVISSGLATK